jgi:hypothetical protein
MLNRWKTLTRGVVLPKTYEMAAEVLPRDLYVKTAKILDLLGGKWNRTLAAHVFEGDCVERVDEAVIAGEVTDFKKLYQFYETPPELARRMVAMADVREGHRVLEPSAGKGAILKALPPTVHRTAVELNGAMVDLVALANRVHYGDFLRCNGELGSFDRIIANPAKLGREVAVMAGKGVGKHQREARLARAVVASHAPSPLT